MYQVYLIGYTHSKGTGRTFNFRNDGQPPSIRDIESMEKKIAEKNVLDCICITSVSRIADSETLEAL